MEVFAIYANTRAGNNGKSRSRFVNQLSARVPSQLIRTDVHRKEIYIPRRFRRDSLGNN